MMEHQLSSDERERERRNRFAYTGADTPRSASQPPTTNGDGFYSMPAMQIYGSPGGRIGNGNGGGSGAYGAGGHSSSPWAMPVSGQGGRGGPSLARSASSSIGIPSSLPRSSSFSERLGYGAGGAGGGGGSFANAIRESHSFPSTFEDDESEVMSDATGEYTYPSESAGQARGRHFLAGDTRSRSQSLAAATTTSRPLPIGSPPASAGWAAGSGPLSIPGRFGDFKIPGSGSGGTGLGSRYGSLGAVARSPVGVGVGGATSSPSPTGGLRVSNNNNNPGGAAHAELTNISPLARDVGQIMLDEENFNNINNNNNNSSVWVGNGNGGESGTTSRRHSVSVVQPRRGIVGFNAPDRDAGGHGQDDGSGNGQPFYLQSNGHGSGNGGSGLGGAGGGGGGGGGGGLTISDDELAVGLNMLQLNASQQQQQQHQRPSRHSLPPSQPSSLPIYAPLSRTSQDAHAHGPGSLAESLSIPTGEHFPGRGPGRMLRSPSESGYSVSSGGGSPPASHSPALESSASASPYISRQHVGGGQQHQHQHQHQHQQQRYVPGHGIQYIPEDAPAPSPAPGPVPTSPTFMRSVAGPNKSFMLGLQGQVQVQGQTGPLSPTRGQQIQQMQMQQLLQQHQHQQQQQQYGGAPILQRRTSQSEGFFGHPHQPLHIQTQTQQHPQQQQHQQNTFADVGRGVPLSAVPPTWSLYIVEFKAGRTDLFYVPDTDLAGPLQVGDLVIVEADRGKDLGKVVNDTITAAEVEAFQRQQQQQQQQQSLYSEHGAGYGPTSPDGLGHSTSTGTGVMGVGGGKKEIMPKKIYGKATAQDAQLLVAKHADEAKALALCQTKVKQRKLPMEVIDAEYQWDRRKLTFYFVAEKRIDFRELVRELFRLYKTRIWMASLQGPTSPE